MYKTLGSAFYSLLINNEYEKMFDLATEIREAVNEHTAVEQYYPRGLADEVFYDIYLGSAFTTADDIRKIAEHVPAVGEIVKAFLAKQ